MPEIHPAKQKLLEIFDQLRLSQSSSKSPKQASKLNHQAKLATRPFDKSSKHQSRKLSKFNHQVETIPQSLTTWQKQRGLTIKSRSKTTIQCLTIHGKSLNNA
ncbi:hypothetical protein GmHk_06G017722 [Glycine max]|nr:hypothetical protein GmHk_06G017722 [Glycine max]